MLISPRHSAIHTVYITMGSISGMNLLARIHIVTSPCTSNTEKFTGCTTHFLAHGARADHRRQNTRIDVPVLLPRNRGTYPLSIRCSICQLSAFSGNVACSISASLNSLQAVRCDGQRQCCRTSQVHLNKPQYLSPLTIYRQHHYSLTWDYFPSMHYLV